MQLAGVVVASTVAVLLELAAQVPVVRLLTALRVGN
jgi:hypothetical protein